MIEKYLALGATNYYEVDKNGTNVGGEGKLNEGKVFAIGAINNCRDRKN